MSEEREAHKSKCSAHLRVKGKPYPRTCGECGLGPCKFIASALMAQAMDSEQADHQSLGWAKPTKPLTTPDAIKDSSPKVSQENLSDTDIRLVREAILRLAKWPYVAQAVSKLLALAKAKGE